jgi:hypothetical protein
MKLKAVVEIELIMNDGESLHKASDRLYDLLYEGICCNADASCDFWIESTEEVD